VYYHLLVTPTDIVNDWLLASDLRDFSLTNIKFKWLKKFFAFLNKLDLIFPLGLWPHTWAGIND
jgi:hypothetical protein